MWCVGRWAGAERVAHGVLCALVGVGHRLTGGIRMQILFYTDGVLVRCGNTIVELGERY